MTLAEKILLVRELVENDTDATDAKLTALLKKAESAIQLRMYPFGLPKDTTFSVPAQYEYLQCDLAQRYFNRRGGEGEALHIENGIDRHYGSVNDEDLLMEICQVITL